MTSQPDIAGTPSTLQEIRDSMRQWKFKEISDLHLGYTSSLSFYREEDQIAVFDAHPANSVTSQGIAFPIDFMIQNASESMVAEITKRMTTA